MMPCCDTFTTFYNAAPAILELCDTINDNDNCTHPEPCDPGDLTDPFNDLLVCVSSTWFTVTHDKMKFENSCGRVQQYLSL